MEPLILDRNLRTIAALDTFTSFIWTERFNDYGDFELYFPIDISLFSYLQANNYIYIKDSEKLMIIEDFQIETNAEEGNFLIVTGRSLESILERRILLKPINLTGNFQNAILRLLNENFINPANPKRKIQNLIFKASTNPEITALTLNTQFIEGEVLLDVIWALCVEQDIGFKITLTEDDKFEFELYKGVNRSYSQETIPWVVFSPNFENLLNTNYLESTKTMKTAALVGGEGEGSERKMIEVADSTGGGEGLDRLETFIDMSGLRSEIDGIPMTELAYYQLLASKGREALAEHVLTRSFEGSIDPTRQFIFNKDFFLGDVVQIVNEFGMEATSKVVEVVRSHDATGESVIPTFTVFND